MKKLLSILLTMLMLVSVICIAPVSTSAADVEIAQTGVTMTGGEVLYLVPNSNWHVDNARFAAYFFGSGDTWESFTKVEGEDNLYTVTVPAGSWTNVIFCRMNPGNATNSWDTKWNQSIDLVYDGTNNCYTVKSGTWDKGGGTWSVYTPAVVEPDVPDEPEVPTEPVEITFYAINSAKWDDVYAYAWIEGGANLGWPGNPMTKTDETINGFDVYSITLDTEYESVIFNNNNMGAQTPDLTLMADQYYDIKAGTWYASLDDVPPVDATATDVYLVGGFNGWSTTANEFKLTEDGVTATVTLDLDAAATYEFKVVREGAWTSNATPITATVEGLAFSSSVEDNAKITTTEAGTYTFTWNVETSCLAVTYPVVETPDEPEEPTGIPAGYYLVGTLSGMDFWSVDESSDDRLFVENTANEGEYMLSYTFEEGDEIKVVYFDGTVATYWYNDGGDNFRITAENAGEATVYFRPEGNNDWSYFYFIVLPVADPEPEEPADPQTVYFVDYVDNFTEVYAYAWTGEGETADIAAQWPGVKMNATGETISVDECYGGGVVYTVTFDKAYDNIIFAGNYEVGGEILSQTEDLTFEANKYCYFGNECWYNSIEDIISGDPIVPDEPDDPEVPEPAETITIYFENNWSWPEVYIYYWDNNGGENATWPGMVMTDIVGKNADGVNDIYKMEVPADIAGIVFSGEGAYGRDQSDNVTDIKDGYVYYMTWDAETQTKPCGSYEYVAPSVAQCKGYTARLESTIAFNLIFEVSDDVMADPDAVLNVTTVDGTLVIPVADLGIYILDKNLYMYTVSVPAKNMTDTITVQIITSLVETEPFDTSLQKYFAGFLNNPEMFPYQQGIVKALLNYGAAAQMYFGYNTDNLANAILTEEERAVATADLSAYAPVIDGESDEFEYMGSALVLKSETTLKLYFAIDDTDIPEGENSFHWDGVDFIRSGDLWYVAYSDIDVTNLATALEFTVDGISVNFSALSYAYLAQQSSKTELVNLANALAAYYAQAAVYA